MDGPAAGAARLVAGAGRRADRAVAEDRRREGMNTLYFGDNLEVLRESIADRSVDLVYLDPPFNSGANYNIIFQPEKKSAAKATAQIQAFEDTWTWSAEADETYRRFVIDRDLTSQPPGERLIKLMTSMREYLGETPMMAYLTMMAPRLLELRRVLKDTGSIYLHCDPTASHYLKLLMDAVFGVCLLYTSPS